MKTGRDIASGDLSALKDNKEQPVEEEEPTDTGKKKLKKPLKEDSGIPKQ